MKEYDFSIEATLYAARKILRPCPGAEVAGLDLWRAAREVVHQWKMRACTPWELDAAMRDGTLREFLPTFFDVEIVTSAVAKPFEFQKVEVERCKLLTLDQIYKMEPEEYIPTDAELPDEERARLEMIFNAPRPASDVTAHSF